MSSEKDGRVHWVTDPLSYNTTLDFYNHMSELKANGVKVMIGDKSNTDGYNQFEYESGPTATIAFGLVAAMIDSWEAFYSEFERPKK